MSLLRLTTQAIRVVTTRPAQFWGSLRGYLLFAVKTRLARVMFGPSSGIRMGRNVRIQKLSSLSAERPGASILLGDHCIVYENAQIAAFGNGVIEIGERTVLGDVRIYSRKKIRIGARVVFSWNVFMQDFTPHPTEPERRAEQMISLTDRFMPSFDGNKPATAAFAWDAPCEEITIGDDAWLGANCTVLPGARIGAGSIVATGAIVTRGEYPAKSILAGNPARVVKSLE